MGKTKSVRIRFPEELEYEILKLRADDRYMRMSVSELVRMLVKEGLKANATTQTEKAGE